MSLPTSSLASPPPVEPMRRLHVVSPVDYNERCQNALKLIQMKGMPDLVTMTCNPQWPEIRGADACAQWSSDRIAVHASHLPRPQDRVVPGYSRTSPDAVKYLYKYVYKGTDRIMPRPSTHTLPTPPIVAVTEFQKKSLPHVHSLVCRSTKLTTTAQFDAVA